MERVITFSEAIREATIQSMEADERILIMGLGVPDPKGIFGTTSGLQQKFGASRVMDMPTAEACMTGAAIGASLMGLRPIVTHQRVEFSLLAIDQLVNQAAKWRYMTNGTQNVPLMIRMIIGRGWGQGPQHSQSLESWFAHVPGLTVFAPATPSDAKGLLMAGLQLEDPVVFLEHRWLHGTRGLVDSDPVLSPVGKARVLRSGTDVTIVGFSYSTVESLVAAEVLAEAGIDAEVLDLRSLRPLDQESILQSVAKTGRLITVDVGWSTYGIGAEIIATVVEALEYPLESAPIRLGLAPAPVPSTRSLANHAYPGAGEIVRQVAKLFRVQADLADPRLIVSDQPNVAFTGPF